MNPVKRYQNTLALAVLILPHALEITLGPSLRSPTSVIGRKADMARTCQYVRY